ncbi:MAG: hypothetical protein IPK82_03650 [Polyangiaceae bacterium]|nr:hypothetical protein [Polyangiaceae bacterium]
MRITITIDNGLFEAAKQRASEKGATLSAFIQDAVRAALTRGTQGKRKHRFKLITFRGDGPLPCVDLDRTSTLLETDGQPRT